MQLREHRHRPVSHFRMICKGSISVQPCGECIEENVLGRDTNPNALRIFGASHNAEEGGAICEPPSTGLPPPRIADPRDSPWLARCDASVGESSASMGGTGPWGTER